MPKVPDIIINKTAERFQIGFAVAGVLSVLAGYGFLSKGEIGSGLLAGAIAGGLFFIASKIKTKKRYVGGSARYR